MSTCTDTRTLTTNASQAFWFWTRVWSQHGIVVSTMWRCTGWLHWLRHYQLSLPLVHPFERKLPSASPAPAFFCDDVEDMLLKSNSPHIDVRESEREREREREWQRERERTLTAFYESIERQNVNSKFLMIVNNTLWLMQPIFFNIEPSVNVVK